MPRFLIYIWYLLFWDSDFKLIDHFKCVIWIHSTYWKLCLWHLFMLWQKVFSIIAAIVLCRGIQKICKSLSCYVIPMSFLCTTFYCSWPWRTNGTVSRSQHYYLCRVFRFHFFSWVYSGKTQNCENFNLVNTHL